MVAATSTCAYAHMSTTKQTACQEDTRLNYASAKLILWWRILLYKFTVIQPEQQFSTTCSQNQNTVPRPHIKTEACPEQGCTNHGRPDDWILYGGALYLRMLSMEVALCHPFGNV
jgi:hypothetical protein